VPGNTEVQSDIEKIDLLVSGVGLPQRSHEGLNIQWSYMRY